MIPAATSRKLLLAACLLLTLPATAAAQTLDVDDKASFDQAVAVAQPGDEIALADGTYPALAVKRRFDLPGIAITGGRGALLGGLQLKGAAYVSVTGVTFTPTPGRAWSALQIDASQHVVADDVLVDGVSQRQGAWVKVFKTSSDVTISNSELTNCGEGERCVAPGGSDVLVQGNWFHDCQNCDMLRGGGTRITLEDNTFERALRGPCSGVCNHNDLVQIMGGAHWLVRGNTFGARQGGAAQVFVNPNAQEGGVISDVVIDANTFGGADMAFGLTVGGTVDAKRRAPSGVRITGNVITTGTRSSLKLPDAYASFPQADRPVVSGNTFAKLKPRNCALGTFTDNVVTAGNPCG